MAKKISIKGEIISNGNKWIYDWLGMDATCPKDIISILDSVNSTEDIIIEMNSGGGSVIAAHEIYTSLISYQGNIEIHVVGISGSAASEILTACKSLISPVGLVMIHNSSTEARGDYRVMDSTSNMLKSVNQSIRNAYKAKTGLSDEELKELMDKATWMSAQEAVDMGIVDGIMFENEEDPQKDFANVIQNVIQNKHHIALYNSTGHLSQDAIDKLRTVIKQDEFNNINLENIKPAEMLNTIADQQACILDKNIIPQIEGGKIMNLQELLKEHPELQNEISALEDTARKSGITEERGRLQAIDNIAASIPQDLVAKAKYTEIMNASELALKVISDTAASGKNYFVSALADSKASGVDNVITTPTDPKDMDEDEALINMAVQAANSKRKVGK